MSPPIYTPDGSEVSEIVLPDGSTASEVIGPDGNVVFEAGPDIPDSAIHQYDAQAVSASDGGSVTTLQDQIGSHDIDGSGTFRDSGINGFASVELNGSDDGYLNQFGTAISEPYTILAVVEITGSTSDFHTVHSDRWNNQRTDLRWDEDRNWYLFSGNNILDGSADETIQLVGGIYDSTDKLREGGGETASGDAGGHDLTGVSIGQTSDNSLHFEGYVGEVVYYDSNLEADGDLASEEQRLADKWGITL